MKHSTLPSSPNSGNIFVGRSLSVKDVKNGFKYKAWLGYEWVEVEYPKTGFNREQLIKLIKGRSSLVQPI